MIHSASSSSSSFSSSLSSVFIGFPSTTPSLKPRCKITLKPSKKKPIKRLFFLNRALPPKDDPSSSSSLEEDQEYLASMASLSSSFGRRLGIGLSLSLAVAVGGNLGGITSFLLGLNDGMSRMLKLDVVYPIQGFKRCLEKDFEFVYPETWVGDQRLLYRAVEKAERQRLYGIDKNDVSRRNGLIEPIVAFGPPGSSGELNVSVVVAPIPSDFSLYKIGDPKEVGEVILKSFVASTKSSLLSPSLINAEKSEEMLNGQQLLYYKLEFSVKAPSFMRHNVSVYVAYNGKLLSMSAQTPEALWPKVKDEFFKMADSFRVI